MNLPNRRMNVTLNVVSTLCWEIIETQTLCLPAVPLPPLKLFLDAVYDFYPAIFNRPFKIYWKYSSNDYLEVVEYFSLTAFLTLAVPLQLYLIIGDADNSYPDTGKLLKMLDLKELKRIKEAERNKYDLKSEADLIEEQILQCQQSLDSSTTALTATKANDDKDIIQFALRKMPVRRCYTADICSGYSLVDCVRKAMKGRIINCSPHQDIYFLETHAKNEESNLENLFVSPAGREMLKYKPNTKLKQKINTNLEFLTTIQNPSRQSTLPHDSNKTTTDKCGPVTVTSSVTALTSNPSTSSTTDSEKSGGLDLYEEAAAILGLTCSQTDDCRCIECQCHYFDFEEEIDFPTAGNEYGQLLSMDHTSSCSIQ